MESLTDIVTYFDNLPSNGSNNDNNGNGGTEEAASNSKIKFDPEALYYDMSGHKHLVVFNHYKYHTNTFLDPRNHTEEDVKALESTFSNLGFTVEVHTDLDRETIWKKLLKMRSTDYSASSCLCIAILTHGSTKDLLHAYDQPYYLVDVLKLFETHPTLAGKPKLFFIQACRGLNMDAGNRIQTDGNLTNYIITPSHADFLILRSTVEDYVSWRDAKGTWMIQELCDGIGKYYQQLDILHIVTLVQKKVEQRIFGKVPRSGLPRPYY